MRRQTIEHKLEFPIIVSPSRCEVGARCFRRHMIGDILSYGRERISASLEFGGLAHEMAARHWQGENALEWVLALDADHPAFDQKRHTKALLIEATRAYVDGARVYGAHWAHDSIDWTIKMLEERVTIDIDPRARLTFQLDRFVQGTNDGELVSNVLIDTKTTGWLNARWTNQWPLSLQQKLYRWALRELGYKIDYHFIEGIEKKTGKTAPAYYTLPEWSDEELDEAKELAVTIAQKSAGFVADCLDPASNALDFDRLLEHALCSTEFNPHDCFSYGVTCDYYELCTAPPSQRLALARDALNYQPPLYLD